MKFRIDISEEERKILDKVLDWDEIKRKIDEDKTNKINEIIDVPEKILDKKIIQSKLSFYKALYSDSKVEAVYILLHEVLGIPEGAVDVNMFLGMLAIYQMLYDFLKYSVNAVMSSKTKIPVSPMLPILVENIEDEASNSGMYR